MHRPPRGLKQPLPQNLKEHTHGKNTADPGIGNAAFHSLRNLRLHGKIPADAEQTEEHEQHHGNQLKKNSVSRRAIRGLLILLPQALGQQAVYTNTQSHREAHLQILHREGQRQGGNRAFGHLGHIDTVHNIIQRLNQHGNNHGQGHIHQELRYGHHAHLVFCQGFRFHILS